MTDSEFDDLSDEITLKREFNVAKAWELAVAELEETREHLREASGRLGRVTDSLSQAQTVLAQVARLCGLPPTAGPATIIQVLRRRLPPAEPAGVDEPSTALYDLRRSLAAALEGEPTAGE